MELREESPDAAPAAGEDAGPSGDGGVAELEEDVDEEVVRQCTEPVLDAGGVRKLWRPLLRHALHGSTRQEVGGAPQVTSGRRWLGMGMGRDSGGDCTESILGGSGDDILLQHFNGRFLRANGRYLPWNNGASVDDFDMVSTMTHWVVERIPAREGMPEVSPLLDSS